MTRVPENKNESYGALKIKRVSEIKLNFFVNLCLRLDLLKARYRIQRFAPFLELFHTNQTGSGKSTALRTCAVF